MWVAISSTSYYYYLLLLFNIWWWWAFNLSILLAEFVYLRDEVFQKFGKNQQMSENNFLSSAKYI